MKAFSLFSFTYGAGDGSGDELNSRQKGYFLCGQPDDFNYNEDCVVVDLGEPDECPGLNDQPCDYCYAYVCQKD